MDSKKFNLLMSVIGLVLFIFFIINTDFTYLKNFSFSLTLLNVSVLLFIIFFMFAVRTWRWMIYLSSIGVNLKFWEAYKLVVPSIAFALFTPAQSGDLLKIEFLKIHKNIPRRESIATVFVEKLMDLLLVLIIFCIALLYFSLKIVPFNWITVLIAVLVAIAVLAAGIKLLSKKQNVLKRILHNTRKIIANPKTMFYATFLTVIYWISVGLNWMFVGYVVNINIPFFMMLGVLSVGTILGLLSFIPGALGVMEYSTVFLLSTFLGIPAAQATIFALSSRIYSVIMYVIAYLHLFFKRA